MSFKDWLVPREERFFDLIEAQSANVLAGATRLAAMVADGADLAAGAAELRRLEREGDRHVDGVHDALNRSFITPIDREDIAALSGALDDVLDHTERAARHLHLHQVTAPPPEVARVASLLLDQARELDAAFKLLRDPTGRAELSKRLAEVRRLGDDAEDVATAAMAHLLARDDLRFAIKMRDVFRSLDRATDTAAVAAGVLRDLLVKHT
ncbi:MAG TPA: DUF47 family protein [Candidatus Thermoplasmatota archaeon]|nr:DUF47 family protein [Candidatus Thermoplasmatota archaeon]